MALKLTDEQKVLLKVAPKTAAGNPAHVDGDPVWDVSNPDILEIVPTEDPFQVEVVTKGPLGSCQVSVTVDADLGDGVRNITGVLDVDVVAAEAASVGIEAGAPELR